MNIATFITARLKSTRLKRKVLLPICGKPMIGHLVDRLSLSKKSSQIILCTSDLTQDDDLEKFSKDYGIKCFRGHPDDVMVRLRDAADYFKIDLISSCTADNPLIDNISMDQLIDYHICGGYDFSISNNLPLGSFTMTVNKQSLQKACEIKNSTDTEFWPQYFLRTNFFKLGSLNHDDKKVARPEIRLTVDEVLDFKLIDEIYRNLIDDERIFTLAEVINFLDKNPSLKKLNSSVIQKAPVPITLKSELAA